MARLLLVLLTIGVVLAAAIVSDRPLPRADLVWIEPSDFNTLDPQRMSHLPDFRIASAIYEGLVRVDTTSEDLHPVPALARAWEISSDGLVYTFHLDPAGRWSNGDPVTAEDFIFAWRRALMPETGADYIKMFQFIRGGREFSEWRAARLAEYAGRPEHARTREAAQSLLTETHEQFARTVGVEAVDPLTLRVTLERPVPFFLDLCAFGPFLPVHRASVERWMDADPMTAAVHERHGWTKPPHLVGNGPYVVASWRFKREMRLERNPLFRDPSLARSRTITVRFIEEANTALLAFQSGAADWHSDMEVEYIGDLLEAVREGRRDDVRAFDAFGTYFWSFNCKPKLADGRENPFHDARVRRAFARSVDRRAIVGQVRRGAERPASVFIPPGSIPGFESPAGLGFDVEEARRELKEAGWIGQNADGVPVNLRGEPFPTVEMLITPTGAHRSVALVLARMFESALGVKSKVIVKETKVYRSALKQQDYMMARGAWFGDYLDPTTFLDIHRSTDGNNDRAYSDPIFDALLDAASREPDAARRMTLLEEAERHTMEETLPILPIWHYAQYYLCRPPLRPDGSPNPGGLQGLSEHPRLIQYPFLLEVVPR